MGHGVSKNTKPESATDSSAAAATSRLAEAVVAASYPRFVDEGLRFLSVVFNCYSYYLGVFGNPEKTLGLEQIICSYDRCMVEPLESIQPYMLLQNQNRWSFFSGGRASIHINVC